MEMKTIGNKITEARKKVSLSQAQLAEQLFISAQAVGKWERGESLPDIITFNRLAEILGVDLNYFSENFKSTVTENSPVDSMSNKPTEKELKKHNWDMSRGNWVDANFSELKNLHEKFSSSNMQRCLFVGSDLSGLLLKGNNIDKSDFSGSNFSKSQIQKSHISKNKFIQCTLQETEFFGSYISGCDFTNADFTGVTFTHGGFEKNIITNAKWNRTSFLSTYIADIIFEGTIEDCYFEGCSFSNITFQNAILTNTFFKNKSLKGIKFIDCQADRMTYEFLKNGKANLDGITIL
jgi:uncharacterized protein YjbI with pentapeptide repeats